MDETKRDLIVLSETELEQYCRKAKVPVKHRKAVKKALHGASYKGMRRLWEHKYYEQQCAQYYQGIHDKKGYDWGEHTLEQFTAEVANIIHLFMEDMHEED